MTETESRAYIRYLEAKKALDDRSLNRQVWDRLAEELRHRGGDSFFRVLEMGCGIGTMLERLGDWGLLRQGFYTGIDREEAFITEAVQRLHALGASSVASGRPGELEWRQGPRQIRVQFLVADVSAFASRDDVSGAFDLIIAHAFLDLVDLAGTLPSLLSLLSPGGLFYFTLNFDGVTSFLPALDPRLDALIETLYHDSMDRRRADGKPSGSSRTGRDLFNHLPAAGGHILAAGSSDWVVFPVAGGYSKEEAYFLHFIIDTVGRALTGQPELPGAAFANWLRARHRQVERGELVYLAHQLDFCGFI